MNSKTIKMGRVYLLQSPEFLQNKQALMIREWGRLSKIIKVECERCNRQRMSFLDNIINNRVIMWNGVNRSGVAVIFICNVPKGQFKGKNEVVQIFAFISGREAMEDRFAANMKEEESFNLVSEEK